MSTYIPRYIVRSVPPIPPATSYWVLDRTEQPARMVADCPSRNDAERVRAGLELVHALEVSADAPVEILGTPI